MTFATELITAAAAAEATGEYCFDCPAEPAISFVSIVSLFVGLSILALPGFFAGVIIHRLMPRVAIIWRLVLVFAIVPMTWLSWASGKLTLLVLCAAVFATGLSFIDASRLKARESTTRFTEI